MTEKDAADLLYEHAGLSRVVLVGRGVEVVDCPACGLRVERVADEQQLLQVLGLALLIKDPGMTGEELRYLRTLYGMTQAELEQFVALPDQIRDDLRRSTDHAVDLLWAEAPERGASMAINRISRLVCDVERFARDADEPSAAFGRGVIYTRTSSGEPLRRCDDLTIDERQPMFDRYWRPWHVMIGDMVDYLLEDCEFPAVTIIDTHSFPDEPLPFEPDQFLRLDIYLGWNDFHTPEALECC